MNMNAHTIDLSQLEVPAELASIRRIGDGFRNFQAVRAGFASGIFDWLAANAPAEKAAIATALKLRGAHLGAFLQTLEDLGLLARENGAYRLAAGMERVLCAGSPWCRAPVFEALSTSPGGWADLPEFMAEGWSQPPRAVCPVEQNPFLGEARRLAAHLVARLAEHPGGPSPRSLICFDGGDGLLAAALCQRLPEAHMLLVVAPESVPNAHATLAASGLYGRCRIAAGSPLDLPPVGAGFDYAVLFHSLYPVRRNTLDALTAVAASLAPGGELCSAHWFCLEACETAPGGLRDLDKAVLTDSHPLCHVEQFCQRLEEAGLVDVERGDLAGEYGNTKLHFGRRPAAC